MPSKTRQRPEAKPQLVAPTADDIDFDDVPKTGGRKAGDNLMLDHVRAALDLPPGKARVIYVEGEWTADKIRRDADRAAVALGVELIKRHRSPDKHDVPKEYVAIAVKRLAPEQVAH